MTDHIAAVRAHVDKHADKERATFSIAGVKALLAQVDGREPPLTVAVLADAFSCFWNAAIGDAHQRQDSTAFAVIASMAEGFAAVERRLREHELAK